MDLGMVCGSKTWIIICMLLLAPFDEKGVLRSWIMSTGSGLGLAKKRCNVKACGDRRLVSTAPDFCFFAYRQRASWRLIIREKDFIPLSRNVFFN